MGSVLWGERDVSTAPFGPLNCTRAGSLGDSVVMKSGRFLLSLGNMGSLPASPKRVKWNQRVVEQAGSWGRGPEMGLTEAMGHFEEGGVLTDRDRDARNRVNDARLTAFLKTQNVPAQIIQLRILIHSQPWRYIHTVTRLDSGYRETIHVYMLSDKWFYLVRGVPR